MNFSTLRLLRSRSDTRTLLLVCAVWGLYAALPAYAQIVIPAHTATALGTCSDQHFYNSHSTDAPSIVARSFHGRGNVVTFRVCRDMDGNTHYFVRKPRPNRNGICRVFEQELFPGSERDTQIIDVLYDGTAPGWYFTMTGWKSWPPKDWAELHYSPQTQILALESGGACPPSDDKGYVPVGLMTDGMLNGFFKLWHEVSSSPEAFDKAFANTTSVADAGLGFKEDHAALVQKLRDDLFKKGHARPTLQLLDCVQDNLPGCSADFERFVVGFDVTDRGVTLTRIDPVLIP